MKGRAAILAAAVAVLVAGACRVKHRRTTPDLSNEAGARRHDMSPPDRPSGPMKPWSVTSNGLVSTFVLGLAASGNGDLHLLMAVQPGELRMGDVRRTITSPSRLLLRISHTGQVPPDDSSSLSTSAALPAGA